MIAALGQGLKHSWADEPPGELAPHADFGWDSVGLRWDLGIDLTNMPQVTLTQGVP